MGRLKVTYAPPGTDPTRMPSDPPKVGGLDALKDNWLLIGGLVLMLLFAPKMLGIQVFSKNEEEPQTQAVQQQAVTPTPTAATDNDNGLPADWCLILDGQPVPPGVYAIGTAQHECRGGELYELELGATEANQTNLSPPTMEPGEEQAAP
jgi:hypothetical protein